MDLELTSNDIWFSTLVFAILDLIVLVPLVFLYTGDDFLASRNALVISTALFWGVLATLAIFGFWELYYQYIFPAWMRWLAPFDAIIYALFGFGLWWLATHLPGSYVLWFVILGGIEGIAEHLLGIYGLRVLEKVPWLQGITSFPVIVFSFFEYIFYWSIVAWLAFIGLKIAGLIAGR